MEIITKLFMETQKDTRTGKKKLSGSFHSGHRPLFSFFVLPFSLRSFPQTSQEIQIATDIASRHVPLCACISV